VLLRLPLKECTDKQLQLRITVRVACTGKRSIFRPLDVCGLDRLNDMLKINVVSRGMRKKKSATRNMKGGFY